MRIKIPSIVSLIGILTVLVLGTCTPKPTKVRIGYVPYSSSTPFFVAMEKGLFRDNNLDVDPVKFQTSNEAMDALIRGDVASVAGVGFPTYFAIEQNSPGRFKVIWGVVETNEKSVNSILVPVDSTLTSIEQLKGKRVGTFTGSTQVMNLKAMFKTFMDPDKDVQIIQVSPQLQLQALSSKQFDALFTIEPIPTIAVEQGIARIMIDNPRCRYILNPFPAGGAVISTAYIQANPENAKRLVQAMNQAIDSIRLDEASAKALLPKYTPIEAAIASKSRLYNWWKTEEMNNEDIQKLADVLLGWKELSKKVDTSQMAYK